MSYWLLYLVALIEGFSTLAVEIIALRIAAPVTGSSSIVTSVFLGIILLALSAGYWAGGEISSRLKKEQIRELLGGYLIFSGLFYAFISFGFQTQVLTWGLEQLGYIPTLFLTACLLFVLPVFVASQTIPLMTELLPDQSKGKAAGKMLFASTVGSFLGSVGTSLVLFQYLGVTLSGIVVSMSLLVATAILRWATRRKRSILVLVLTVLTAASLYVDTLDKDTSILYSFDSAYQHIDIQQRYKDNEPVRVFFANGSYSSGIFTKTGESPFFYIRELVNLTEELQPKRILVIGTAGFSYPYEVAKFDFVERIDAIDIDPSVERIAEEYFLQDTLSKKVHFIPQSARYAVQEAIKNAEEYDLIFVDAYNGKYIPEELATQEFFQDIQTLAGHADVFFNFILTEDLSSDLARNLTTTMTSVFGSVYNFTVTQEGEKGIENMIISPGQYGDRYSLMQAQGTIYTDDKASVEVDTMQMYYF